MSEPSIPVIFGCAGPELSSAEFDFFRSSNPIGFILFSPTPPHHTTPPTHTFSIIPPLINLLSNAGDALSSRSDKARESGERFRGAITISTAEQSRDGREGLLVQIQDNGTGVSPELSKKIFEAFVTTKPVGMGTGLGLMLSQRIIEEHQGTLELIQNENAGALFSVWLPREPRI